MIVFTDGELRDDPALLGDYLFRRTRSGLRLLDEAYAERDRLDVMGRDRVEMAGEALRDVRELGLAFGSLSDTDMREAVDGLVAAVVCLLGANHHKTTHLLMVDPTVPYDDPDCWAGGSAPAAELQVVLGSRADKFDEMIAAEVAVPASAEAPHPSELTCVDIFDRRDGRSDENPVEDAPVGLRRADGPAGVGADPGDDRVDHPASNDGAGPGRPIEQGSMSPAGDSVDPHRFGAHMPFYRRGRTWARKALEAATARREGDPAGTQARLAEADWALDPVETVTDPDLLREFIAGAAREFDTLAQ